MADIELPGGFLITVNRPELNRKNGLIAGGVVLVLVMAIVLVRLTSGAPVAKDGLPFVVNLSSEPVGAKVYVGSATDSPIGVTPMTLTLGGSAPRDVTLKADGYVPYKVSFTKEATFEAQLATGKAGQPVLWQAKHQVPGTVEDIVFTQENSRVSYRIGATYWEYDIFSGQYRRLDKLELIGGGLLDPKGQYALQLVQESSRHRLVLADVANQTRQDVVISPLETGGAIMDFIWTPDGRNVLLALGRTKDGKSRVLELNPFTREATTLVESGAAITGSFVFSRSGKKVSFLIDKAHPALAYVDRTKPKESFRQVADLARFKAPDKTISYFANPSTWSADESTLYFLGPRQNEQPIENREAFRSRPAVMYQWDLVHQPVILSTADPEGEDWNFIGSARDGSLIGGYVNVKQENRLELYRVLPDQLTEVRMEPLLVSGDEFTQAVFSNHGEAFVLSTFSKGSVTRWVYVLQP